MKEKLMNAASYLLAVALSVGILAAVSELSQQEMAAYCDTQI